MQQIISLFKHAGGFSLLKRMIKSKVFIYSILHLLINGVSRKSLELLRHGIDLKINNKLKKKYGYILNDINLDQQIDKPTSKTIWYCWLQGIDNAPDLVKKCYQSICENFNESKIVLLTENNIHKYVKLPCYIWDKYQNGVITQTHFSDILRIALLYEHGGTWIDATVYISPTCKIKNYMISSRFFIFQNLKPGSDGSVLNVSSWFITASKGNFLVYAIRQLLYEYWKRENELIDYFLLHHFIIIVSDHFSSLWDMIPKYPNSIPHIFLLSLFKEYNKENYDRILAMTPIHKLSYKFTEEQTFKKNTYYEYFINSEI